jgi:hypothetical protein
MLTDSLIAKANLIKSIAYGRVFSNLHVRRQTSISSKKAGQFGPLYAKVY